MRTKRTLLNMAYALGSSLLLLLLGLVTRRLLVDNFGPQITTASQVVSQLFNFFSIAEFGVGSVISYRLYEQIAAKNEEKISKYMSMYKWAYRVVGLVIAGLALIGAAAYGVWTNGQNFTDAAYLQSLWANVYLWAAVLAVLGNAHHYLHQERAVSRFFTQRSYALYVVHYPVLLLTALLLTERTTLPAALMYLLTLLIGFGVTLGLSEIIRRIPGIRYLVLGIRKENKA